MVLSFKIVVAEATEQSRQGRVASPRVWREAIFVERQRVVGIRALSLNDGRVVEDA